MIDITTPMNSRIQFLDRLENEKQTLMVVHPADPADDRKIQIVLSDDNLLQMIAEFAVIKSRHDRRSRG